LPHTGERLRQWLALSELHSHVDDALRQVRHAPNVRSEKGKKRFEQLQTESPGMHAKSIIGTQLEMWWLVKKIWQNGFESDRT
jgi:hypothetical protein